MDFDSSSATQVTGALQDADLDTLLNTHFAGRVVRKDLTQRVKEGANVPVYVLEYLLVIILVWHLNQISGICRGLLMREVWGLKQIMI
nr:anti-phage BREX system Lon protease BrxL [Halomonas sp.]